MRKVIFASTIGAAYGLRLMQATDGDAASNETSYEPGTYDYESSMMDTRHKQEVQQFKDRHV